MTDFEQDKHETPVIFRVFEGDVIAIFPCLPWSLRGTDVASYMHVGQHGAAEPAIVYRTRLAKPEEYEPLKRELEGRPFGCRLKVYKRITPEHRRACETERRRLRATL